MQSSHPPHPSFPSGPGPEPGESDAELVAQLTGAHARRHRAVALLLARHWRATRDYAAVCLTATGPSAQLVATAAFHDVLGRLTSPAGASGSGAAGDAARGAAAGALRPQLLVAVRESVRAWAADDGACVVIPELRKTTSGRGLRATMNRTPERRRVAERAYLALPVADQCLLWHTEVEAEAVDVPAGLSGMDHVTASAALDQAREQFRTGCVRAHRELAPFDACRSYNHHLGRPGQQGPSPEMRRHLAGCAHCRHATDQLGHFEGRLDVLLAETVLGWGARRYLDSRPGRASRTGRPGTPENGCGPGGDERRRSAAAGRRRRALVLGAGLASIALLATVFVVRGWRDDNAVRGPGSAWSAGSADRVGRSGAVTPARHPSAALPAGDAPEEGAAAVLGRLREPVSGRCLEAAGAGAVPLVTVVRPAGCSSAGSQQWSYRGDGVMRSAIDPTRCLAAGPGGLTLADCGTGKRDAGSRYGLTVRRQGGRITVVPDARRAVPGALDTASDRLWVLETGQAEAPERPGPAAPAPVRPDPGQGSAGAPVDGAPGTDGPGVPGTGNEQYRGEYRPRIAQVHVRRTPQGRTSGEYLDWADVPLVTASPVSPAAPAAPISPLSPTDPDAPVVRLLGTFRVSP
ncbi:hydrolase [Streptomyces sp. NPDC005573]|uniref:hydrolase n=1 Tax=Streptomyces sp. NPDC005573 TaxID=3156890 RepID=UPI0033ABF129